MSPGGQLETPVDFFSHVDDVVKLKIRPLGVAFLQDLHRHNHRNFARPLRYNTKSNENINERTKMVWKGWRSNDESEGLNFGKYFRKY